MKRTMQAMQGTNTKRRPKIKAVKTDYLRMRCKHITRGLKVYNIKWAGGVGNTGWRIICDIGWIKWDKVNIGWMIIQDIGWSQYKIIEPSVIRMLD